MVAMQSEHVSAIANTAETPNAWVCEEAVLAVSVVLTARGA
jgi:hypothetical protein